MTDKKISQLSAASALDGTELVEVVQSGDNAQTTAQAIADLFVEDTTVKITLHSAPSDGSLVAGDCVLWYDMTPGVERLKAKAKAADGTVLTSTIGVLA